jgi:Tol biopolymer transport system component
VRYDRRSRQWVPYLDGLSAQSLDFSPDGGQIAYVTFPEGALWRSRLDGTDRVQLTFQPLVAALPSWSPDGTQIAFTETRTKQPWVVRVIPARGGSSRAVTPDERSQVDATWSPDGSTLAVGMSLSEQHDRPITIQLVDLETGRSSALPRSEGLFSPRWSPDGRYLAALPHDSLQLLLYEFRSGRWRTLVSEKRLLTYPVWSADGRYLFVNLGSSRVRVSVADGRRETVADYDGLRQASTLFGPWVGRGPDDSVVALRDVSIREIFALDLKVP